MKAALLLLLLPMTSLAQSTVATGDPRKPSEPSFPTNICAQVPATKWSLLATGANAINRDPFNKDCQPYGVMSLTGSCETQGGTDYQPSISPTTYDKNAANETLDNAAITTAVAGCAGQTVEIVQGVSGQNAIVLAPSNQTVNIIKDAGVSIYASRNLSDYGGSCGTMSTSGITSCPKWWKVNGQSGIGFYGYGDIHMRAWTEFKGSTNHQSFNFQKLLTYCVAHNGQTIEGSPTCPKNIPNYQKANGPNAWEVDASDSYIFYKSTIREAGQFGFNWEANGSSNPGGTHAGLTVWGASIVAPFEVSNTDCLDPIDGTKVTVANSNFSCGDNHIAIKAKYTHAGFMSFLNNQFGSGIGFAIGFDQQQNIEQILSDGSQFNGNLNATTHAVGLLINSAGTQGGNVTTVTHRNFCMKNEYNAIQFAETNGTYSNLLLQHGTILPSDQPGFPTGQSGRNCFTGISGHTLQAQLDDVQVTGTIQGTCGTFQYVSAYFGPNKVTTALQNQFKGTGVTITNAVTTSPAPYCTASSYKQLWGNLNLYTSAIHNQQTLTTAGPITLEAVLEPSTAVSTKEEPWPTQPITFLDNGNPIAGCTVALSGDGTYAACPIASVPGGKHVYSYSYPGDTFYSTASFGNVVVTNPTATNGAKIGGTVKVGGTGSID